MCESLSRVWLFVTPWTVAHRAFLSREFSRKNTGVDSHSLLQGIFPTQVLNLGLQHCMQTLYPLSHQGRVFQINEWIEMKSVRTHLEIDLLPVVWISHLIFKEIISIYWLWWQFIDQWFHPIYVNLSNMLFLSFSWTYKCLDFLHSNCKKTFKI